MHKFFNKSILLKLNCYLVRHILANRHRSPVDWQRPLRSKQAGCSLEQRVVKMINKEGRGQDLNPSGLWVMSRLYKANMAFLPLKMAVKAPYSTYSRWEMLPKLLPNKISSLRKRLLSRERDSSGQSYRYMAAITFSRAIVSLAVFSGQSLFRGTTPGSNSSGCRWHICARVAWFCRR